MNGKTVIMAAWRERGGRSHRGGGERHGGDIDRHFRAIGLGKPCLLFEPRCDGAITRCWGIPGSNSSGANALQRLWP